MRLNFFYGFVDYIYFLFNFKQIFQSVRKKFAWIRIQIRIDIFGRIRIENFGRIRIRVQLIRIRNTAKCSSGLEGREGNSGAEGHRFDYWLTHIFKLINSRPKYVNTYTIWHRKYPVYRRKNQTVMCRSICAGNWLTPSVCRKV